MHGHTANFLPGPGDTWSLDDRDLERVIDLARAPFNLLMENPDRGSPEPEVPDPEGLWGTCYLHAVEGQLVALRVVQVRGLRNLPDLSSWLPGDYVTLDGVLHSRKQYSGTTSRRLPTSRWLAEFRAALVADPDSLIAYAICY